MKTIRTPIKHFQNLPDYPLESYYVDVDSIQMHFLDEGPKDGQVVLLLHGEPSWSYLYRHMIPPLVKAGFRCIAPDLIGFGKSDKPTKIDDHTYAIHVAWMKEFIETVNLKNITLFCQDWGSLIGLRVAAENQERFARIVLANGGLPTGEAKMPDFFYKWQKFAKYSPFFPIGTIVEKGVRASMTKAEVAAYNAPYPKSKYKKATRAMPQLVPTTPDNPAAQANKAAWEIFENWQKPFLTAFSNKDPITRGGEKVWQEKVPGAKNQKHITIDGAGHFLQEEKGPELAQVITEFCKANPIK